MKKNVSIFLVLLALALIPVTCTFLFSGGEEKGESGEEVEKVEETPSTPTSISTPTSTSTLTSTPTSTSTSTPKAPKFKSFEKARYQEYDALIEKYVADYNAHRGNWAAATKEQAAKMPAITAAQVKAHMIQESGGGDVRSRAAWAKDPLQVNVPGDWNPYKRMLGLRKPRKRNEGTLENNLKAGIMLLARKGYGTAGQPAANNRKGTFDGWRTALERYNGRSDRAADGRMYRECYAERILDRAKRGERTEVAIPIGTRRNGAAGGKTRR